MPGSPWLFGAIAAAAISALLAAWGFRGREVLLGIDLGTTFSAIAYRDNGQVFIAKDVDGADSFPSILAVVGGEYVVGKEALRWLQTNPEVVVVDSKRVIGRAPEDPVVIEEAERHRGRLLQHPAALRNLQTGRSVQTSKQAAACAAPAESEGAGAAAAQHAPWCRKDLAFAIPLHNQTASQRSQLQRHACVEPGSLYTAAAAAGGETEGEGEGSGHEAGIAALVQAHGTRHFLFLTPTAVGCILVSHMRATAGALMRYASLSKTMACIPAEFDPVQRVATEECFSRAGLALVRTLHEPTAAALAYGLHARDAIHYVLVFDMGGGTLDVSVLYRAERALTVIGTAGDNRLGGEDVDACVLANTSVAIAVGHCSQEEVKMEAERVKIVLNTPIKGQGSSSYPASATWSCAERAADGSILQQRTGVVTQAALEEGCGALFERTMAPVRAALENAAVSAAEVDAVVLVGGSSRLQAVRARLHTVFPDKTLDQTVDPDLAVALGAASAGD